MDSKELKKLRDRVRYHMKKAYAKQDRILRDVPTNVDLPSKPKKFSPRLPRGASPKELLNIEKKAKQFIQKDEKRQKAYYQAKSFNDYVNTIVSKSQNDQLKKQLVDFKKTLTPEQKSKYMGSFGYIRIREILDHSPQDGKDYTVTPEVGESQKLLVDTIKFVTRN